MTLTELDRRAARRAFDRAAPEYDRFAALQQEVANRLLERLDYFDPSPDRILDLGCGTGAVGRDLVARHPGAAVIGLDWSTAMLKQAARPPLHDASREAPALRPVCADMQALPLAARSVDLVFSSLAVQCSPDEAALFAEVRRVLRPGGLFLFTSFGPDTLHELRAAWARVDGAEHVHRFADMHDVGDALVAAGFRDPVMDMETLVLEYGDALSLMRELKATGGANVAARRHAGLTGRGKLRRVLEAYENFVRNGRYPASYEVIYGAAFGPREGQPVRRDGGEEATFSVESLKRKRR